MFREGVCIYYGLLVCLPLREKARCSTLPGQDMHGFHFKPHMCEELGFLSSVPVCHVCLAAPLPNFSSPLLSNAGRSADSVCE